MAAIRPSPLKDMIGWILLAAAVLVGVLAFFLIRSYLTSEEARLRADILGERPKMVTVLVPNARLPAGTVLSSANLSRGSLPHRYVTENMLRPEDFPRVEGRVLQRETPAGEPLMRDFVAGLAVRRFSDLLAPGERAISFEASPLLTSSGMLLPGDYVDLFSLVRSKNAATDAPRLTALMERVKVLAAGEQPLRSADQDFMPLSERGRYSQITVGVPLEDAERIILSKEKGDIVYLLRNADDMLPIDIQASTRSGDENGRYLYLSPRNPVGQWRDVSGVDREFVDEGFGGPMGNGGMYGDLRERLGAIEGTGDGRNR